MEEEVLVVVALIRQPRLVTNEIITLSCVPLSEISTSI